MRIVDWWVEWRWGVRTDYNKTNPGGGGGGYIVENSMEEGSGSVKKVGWGGVSG